MEDYPRTLMDFESRFSSEEACVEYLIQMRWPDGFVCPSCGGPKAWRTGRMLFHCAACGRQVSVTAGTIFQGTRKPLQMWFRAMWWVTSQKNGASTANYKFVPMKGNCYPDSPSRPVSSDKKCPSGSDEDSLTHQTQEGRRGSVSDLQESLIAKLAR